MRKLHLAGKFFANAGENKFYSAACVQTGQGAVMIIGAKTEVFATYEIAERCKKCQSIYTTKAEGK